MAVVNFVHPTKVAGALWPEPSQRVRFGSVADASGPNADADIEPRRVNQVPKADIPRGRLALSVFASELPRLSV
jgi:hypothetical protein